MKKGFTLVELLAVIVILAIILVIAVPQIMTTIKDATKASFESSAKMVASQVENRYTVAQTLGKTFNSTGSCMEEWSGLNESDYELCTYEITSDGTAKVTLTGKGKFKDLNVCEGTRNSAESQEEECKLLNDDNNESQISKTREYVLDNSGGWMTIDQEFAAELLEHWENAKYIVDGEIVTPELNFSDFLYPHFVNLNNSNGIAKAQLSQFNSGLAIGKDTADWGSAEITLP